MPSSPTLILNGILNPAALTVWPARVRCADRRPLSPGHAAAERGTASSSGIYREVIPNEKLVFTWAWKSTPERESLVKLTFKNDNGGTLMTLIREQFIYEAPRNRHQSG